MSRRAVGLDFLVAHGVVDRLDPLLDALLDDDFLDHTRGLGDDGFLGTLVDDDLAVAEGIGDGGGAAGRTTEHRYRLVTQLDLLLDGPLHHVAADAGGAEIDLAPADPQGLLGKRQYLLGIAGARGVGRAGGAWREAGCTRVGGSDAGRGGRAEGASANAGAAGARAAK